MECLHRLRDILLDLLEGHAGDRIGDAESSLMNADRVQQRSIGRDIAFVGYLPADFRILVIIEIVPVGVENAVTPKPKRLMNLKIKADRSHTVPYLFWNAEVYATLELSLQGLKISTDCGLRRFCRVRAVPISIAGSNT